MILASAWGGTIRLALIEAGILAEYTLWRPDRPDGVGDLHTGRITARVASLGGVFADLGDATGFLPDSAGGKSVSEGDLVALRITRAAQSGKGPRLALAAGAKTGAAPGLIARGPGPVGDWRALHPDVPIIADDYGLIAELRPRFGAVAYRAGCFAAFEDEIAALDSSEIALPGGARATVSPTPALTAIDIDAGAATGERGGKVASQARLNRAIIPELARQIRLHNLGGAILIDFAGMKPAARASLGPDLAAALARDPLKPRLLGFTALGLAEVLRPRIRPPLHEILHEVQG
ncbi:MAG TPA: ribonuclease E/G [Acidiphilium sp.]